MFHSYHHSTQLINEPHTFVSKHALSCCGQAHTLPSPPQHKPDPVAAYWLPPAGLIRPNCVFYSKPKQHQSEPSGQTRKRPILETSLQAKQVLQEMNVFIPGHLCLDWLRVADLSSVLSSLNANLLHLIFSWNRATDWHNRLPWLRHARTDCQLNWKSHWELPVNYKEWAVLSGQCSPHSSPGAWARPLLLPSGG